jgi:hypothetical protein
MEVLPYHTVNRIRLPTYVCVRISCSSQCCLSCSLRSHNRKPKGPLVDTIVMFFVALDQTEYDSLKSLYHTSADFVARALLLVRERHSDRFGECLHAFATVVDAAWVVLLSHWFRLRV